MVTGIIGKKIGMTQVFGQDGTATPGTVIQAGPCVVVQAKGKATDGYEAVQIGLVEDRPARVRKPLAGHYKKAGVPPTRVRREVKEAPGSEAMKPGDQVLVTGVFDERRSRRRHRHQPRQGLPGRHEAPQLPRRRGDARLDVPSRPRIDRRLVVPVARRQGHARGGPDGRRPRHDAQPQGRADRRREQSAGAAGAVPGAPGGYVIVRKAIARKPDPKPQIEKPSKAVKGKK